MTEETKPELTDRQRLELLEEARTNALLLGRLSTFEGITYTGLAGNYGWVAQMYDDRGTLVAEGPGRPGFPIVVEDPLGGIAVFQRDNPPVVVTRVGRRRPCIDSGIVHGARDLASAV